MKVISGKAGDLVTVKHSNPEGLYELRDGLKPGDVVRLESFDRGWWQVVRESDGLRTTIFLINIDRVVRR